MKRWITADVNEEAAGHLAKAGDLPLPFARLMLARGFTNTDAIHAFCNPRLADLNDPFALPGVELGAKRILTALTENQRIVIFGDYDVDGVTSTSLLFLILREMGADVAPFIPSRIDYGYGLQTDAAQHCLETFAPKLFITVDCGVNSHESVVFLQEHGVDVIITDHHEPGETTATPLALINPKLHDFPDLQLLAGVGVAFKLCHGLVKQAKLGDITCAKDIDLRPYLELVALGTVCDIVPLQAENRLLVRQGLKQLNKTQSLGLLALIKQAGIDQKKLAAYHLGFQLGPRINAAGRLAEASTALKLLTTTDPCEARNLAQELDHYNKDRQDVEAAIVEEANVLIEIIPTAKRPSSLVVAGSGWHPGVVGIVASRLVRKHRKPAIVIAIDEEKGMGHGSCRSLEGFNLIEALDECADYLEGYGGHAMAAGLSVRQDQFEAFKECFEKIAAKRLKNMDLRETIKVDSPLRLPEVNWDLFHKVEDLEPFGMGNPKPVWSMQQVEIISKRTVAQKHAKVIISDGQNEISGIYFNTKAENLPNGLVDISFSLSCNSFRGQESLEIQIKAIRKTVQ